MGRGNESFSAYLGYMIKMAAIPIYGKTPKSIQIIGLGSQRAKP